MGDAIFELLGEVLGFLFGRLFHATGRRLIFLASFGTVRIPSLRHGGADDDGRTDFWAKMAGFVFWAAALALLIYLLLT